MQDILKYEEKKPLSFALMKKFAPPWCTVRLYDGLSKYSSLKAAAGSKPCMIVLYELHERDETAVGHYSLVLLGPKPRYWSSYGFPVDYEVSVTHSEDTLKDLMGDHVNDKVPSEERTHTDVLEVVSLTRNCSQNARGTLQGALLQAISEFKDP